MTLYVKNLRVTTGYLSGAEIEFSPRLTCIIGARGTCKSTIVETIRFLFNVDPVQIRALIDEEGGGSMRNARRGLLSATLGGGTATCEAVYVDGAAIRIERDIGAAPQVYVNDVLQSGVSPPRGVEVYSQGDLQELAIDARLRLGLIDRRFEERCAEMGQTREEGRRRLHVIGSRMRVLRSSLLAKRALTTELPRHREALAQLQRSRPPVSIELAKERELYSARRASLDEIGQGVESLQTMARTMESLERQIGKVVAGTRALATIGHPVADGLAVAFRETSHSFVVLQQVVRRALEKDPEGGLRLLEGHLEVESRRYHELRREKDSANESMRKEDTLRAEITRLEQIEADAKAVEDEVEQLRGERTRLRAQLESLAEELTRLRVEHMKGIESAFGSQIFLTLRPRSDSTALCHLLTELLQRSSLRGQDELAAELARRFSGHEVVRAVEAGDVQLVSERLGRDSAQVARLLGHLSEHARLYELEGVEQEDSLEVEMVVRGARRRIEELSRGQMATALLPLIVRNADYPLVIDQPEDDLDNAYISEALVVGVRRLKQSRQLIFVTHNANIPVLGDAERVIVMDMVAPEVATSSGGTVLDMRDAVLALLEGGREAFRQRSARYGE